MNLALKNLWNDTVTNEDDVYVLGDFLMGDIYESLEFTQQLNGKNILLISGNHDRTFGQKKDCAKWMDIYESYGITVLPKEYIMKIGSHSVTLCHFPYIEGRHDNRFSAFFPTNYGGSLLHGHVHNAHRVKDKMINVGVDCWGWSPISEHWIEAILDQIDIPEITT